MKNEAKQTVNKITLCGSTKFKKEFLEFNKVLTFQKNLVYSVAFFGHADAIPLTRDEKGLLDEIHLAKIASSDEIFVLDVGEYIGDSTRGEIEYAKLLNKKVRYLSDEYPEYRYGIYKAPTPLPNDLEHAGEKMLEILRDYDFIRHDADGCHYYDSENEAKIDLFKELLPVFHQHALSTLPDLIKKVLERAAENAKVIMEPEICTGEMWPTSEIDKQSILDTKFDDLIK